MENKYAPQERYDRANTTMISVKLNKNTDADILEFLESVAETTAESRQGIIKKALRAYIGALEK